MVFPALLSPTSSDGSSAAGYDFDIGFGEIIEYHEESEPFAGVGFTDTFSSSYCASFDDAQVYSASFDRKGKAPATQNTSFKSLDQYHPENSKNEIVQYVQTNESTSGQIPTSNLMHSSEEWSNYHDLCESVKLHLHRVGYSNAKVECIQYGDERLIVYELH